MSPGLPILYICAIAGFLIIAASFFLLWKRRIFLDRATKKVTEIELPFGIRAKSQAPVLILILIGGVLLMYSATEVLKFGEEVTVDGQVKGSATSIELYASVASQSLPQSGAFSLPLPVTHPARKYMLLYAVDGNLIQHQIVDPAVESGRTLDTVELQMPAAPRLTGEIDPVPPGY
jgi:hypothetical protein